MPKTKSNLVIVESPAKAKTIGKYLGPEFHVTSTMGHIRDLPKSRLGVDIEAGFVPDYQPIKGKEDTIEALKKEVKNSALIYLATDPDREGEAISWHLKELLDLPEEKVCRVTFNEITRRVVSESIHHPRPIDQALVDAQQARRILDRIVGYQLSPLLWRKVRRGLSAGRVQSVATRMVVDREQEIRDFESQEYWTLDVTLGRIAPNQGSLVARYHSSEGKKKEDLPSAQAVEELKEDLKKQAFTVSSVKRAEKHRQPAPPFTTSTLQQEASRKLNMTPRRTMSVAQQLYEGVDIEGEGTVGLISYMRTDSLRLSEEATDAARALIQSRYGAEYVPPETRHFKTKSGAQDAHEAIRPTNVNLTPELVRHSLAPELYRLYRLIWSRFVACQMSAAVYDTLSIDITAGPHLFRANHTALRFSGFTAVYEAGQDEEEGERNSPLPDLGEGESLTLEDCEGAQHFTQPPARYSEATLIRALEEKGIGRPSTYAPTISTILGREYVVKEGKVLRSTPLGEVVTQLMVEKFPDVADPAFTAQMEQKLDDVETGRTDWHSLLSDFYANFSSELARAEQDLEGIHLKIPAELSDEVCDVCGRQMVIKSGRFGRFLACPGYPECTFTKPLVVEMPGKCPLCGSRILKKTSRNGYTYYGCERNRVVSGEPCNFMSWDVPVKETCPECGKTLFKKSGRGFKKPFCINEKCSRFLPEDQRGYPKKKAAGEEEAPAEAPTAGAKEGTGAKKSAPAKGTASKSAASKSTASKSTASKSTATKSAASKSTASKKSTSTKAAASRSTASKKSTASRSTASKKSTGTKRSAPTQPEAYQPIPEEEA